MTPDTATDLVAKVGEKGKPACRHCSGERDAGEKYDSDVWKEHKRVCFPAQDAQEAYEDLAVNSFPLLLKALEKEHGHTGHLQLGDHGVVDLTRYAAMGCHACQALATVRDAAQKALREA